METITCLQQLATIVAYQICFDTFTRLAFSAVQSYNDPIESIPVGVRA